MNDHQPHECMNVVALVWGVAQLDNIVYVVSAYLIKMYSADTLSPLGQGIHVDGMGNPNDMVACRDDRQLYISDQDNYIWRVSADDHSYAMWRPTESTSGALCVWTLSLTSRRLLVTPHSGSLHEYSTTDRRLLRVVQLPGYMKELHHGVETTRGTFVVCHRGTPRSEWPSAVSLNFVTFDNNLRCLFNILH